MKYVCVVPGIIFLLLSIGNFSLALLAAIKHHSYLSDTYMTHGLLATILAVLFLESRRHE